jgi:hypothetical protein
MDDRELISAVDATAGANLGHRPLGAPTGTFAC